jgi:hypothetical protein
MNRYTILILILKFHKSKPIEIETIEISYLMSEIPFDVGYGQEYET